MPRTNLNRQVYTRFLSKFAIDFIKQRHSIVGSISYMCQIDKATQLGIKNAIVLATTAAIRGGF